MEWISAIFEKLLFKPINLSSSLPLLVINEYPAPTLAVGGVARSVGLEIVKLPTVSSLEDVFAVDEQARAAARNLMVTQAR